MRYSFKALHNYAIAFPGEWQRILEQGVLSGCHMYIDLPADFALKAPLDSLPERKSISIAVPKEDWPLWARAVARLKKDVDAGVGDTIERVIGKTSSEAFKKWFKAITGHDCGCTQRKEYFNERFPYGTDS
jgi:hypothetical protein